MRILPEKFTSSKRPGFIVFEGVNGAGKSTLLKKASAFLNSQRQNCIETREPGGTELGKTLRNVVQERPDLNVSPITELLLFAADRHEHVEKVIRPALNKNTWVLSDRYLYSTLAFQGYGRGLSLELINGLMTVAIDGVRPDLVVLVDLDPEEGLRRTQKREGTQAGTTDRFEQEHIEFHHRLRDGFLKIADESPDPFLVLNGRNTPDELFSELKMILSGWLGHG